MKYILQFRHVTSFDTIELKQFNGWYSWDPNSVWVIFEKEYNRPSRPLKGEFFELPRWEQVKNYIVQEVTHLHPIEKADEGTLVYPRREVRRASAPLVQLNPDRYHNELKNRRDVGIWRKERREELITDDASQLLERGFWVHDASWNYDPKIQHLRGLETGTNPLCSHCLRWTVDIKGEYCLNCGKKDPYDIKI